MPTDLAYLASLVPITPGGQISRSTNEAAEGRQTAQFQSSSGSTTPAPSSSYPYPTGSYAPSQQLTMKQEGQSLRRKSQDKTLSGLTKALDETRTKYEELKGRVGMFEIREAELSAREKQVQRTQEDFIQREMEVTQKEELVNQREKIVTEREEAVKKEGQKVHAWRVRMKQETVTAVLSLIFSDTNHYKGLLSCDKSDAQAILDSFQLLLDTDNFNDRTQMIAAMRRLSEGTELYPTCFCLDGPFPTLEDDPVSSGAYGDIYKLLYKGRETCCKVIRVYQQSLAERMSKMYAREVIVWGQLRHPNILPFYGISKFRSRVAFISQWASHGDINEYIKQTPHANRILLAFDTACGVKYLHQNDIVHGDLKGVNVLVNSSGRACLGDFGLSSVEDPEIIRWTSQSTVASKGGTTRWQAPELLESEDIAEKVYNSKESDVYAWGGVCYEIFTGRLPFFETHNMATVRNMILRGGTPTCPRKDDPAWLSHRLNDRFWSLMVDCWRTEASERPGISTVVSVLNIHKPADSRPPSHWEGRSSMHYPNAQNRGLPDDSDMLRVWEDLEILLARVAPGAHSVQNVY